MPKTRLEKIESIKEEITQQQNQIKKLLQEQKAQDRKDRTKRLCQRMGLFESLLPETIALTDEQYKTFLEKAIMNVTSRRILEGLTDQNAAVTAPPSAGSAALPITATTAKSADTAQENGADEWQDESNGARVTG